jgi:hypothetical protein
LHTIAFLHRNRNHIEARTLLESFDAPDTTERRVTNSNNTILYPVFILSSSRQTTHAQSIDVHVLKQYVAIFCDRSCLRSRSSRVADSRPAHRLRQRKPGLGPAATTSNTVPITYSGFKPSRCCTPRFRTPLSMSDLLATT